MGAWEQRSSVQEHSEITRARRWGKIVAAVCYVGCVMSSWAQWRKARRQATSQGGLSNVIPRQEMKLQASRRHRRHTIPFFESSAIQPY